jgi:thiol-disulfide isomerase/thioredoxin
LLVTAACLPAVAQTAKPAAVEKIAVEFTAPWCPYCRKIEPTIAKLKEEGFRIQQINVDDQDVSFGVEGMQFKAESGAVAASKFAGLPVASTKIPLLFAVWKDAAGLHVEPIETADRTAIRGALVKAGVEPLPPAPRE